MYDYASAPTSRRFPDDDGLPLMRRNGVTCNMKVVQVWVGFSWQDMDANVSSNVSIFDSLAILFFSYQNRLAICLDLRRISESTYNSFSNLQVSN